MRPDVYSVPQRVVHWLTVLLVFFNLLMPGQIERVTDLLGGGKTPTPEEWTSANLHIWSGIAILALTAIRLVLRLVQGAPEPPSEEPAFFRAVAKVAHGLLYLVLIAMPITGLARLYGGVGVAGFVHAGPMKLLLWILIIGHVLGALAHKFYWKTNVLERMTRG